MTPDEQTPDPAVRLVKAARTFDALFDADDAAWITRLRSALAELYAAACDLPEMPLDADADDPPSPDPARLAHAREVATTRLGASAPYRQFFVPTDLESNPVPGHLVEDMVDILGAVLPLASAQGAAQAAALWDCKYEGFPTHWGARAAHALAALHGLSG